MTLGSTIPTHRCALLLALVVCRTQSFSPVRPRAAPSSSSSSSWWPAQRPRDDHDHDRHYKMIVFDKDGTLSDPSGSLARWVDVMSERVSEEEDASVVPRLHAVLGWDAALRTLVPSAPLAAGTWSDQLDAVAGLLTSSDAETAVRARSKVQAWHDDLGNLLEHDAPLVEDLRGLLEACKQRNLLVALATSDDRKPTDAFLHHWNLHDVVDFSVCGDEVPHGKPSAAPMTLLCERSRVQPSDCIMVGDTTADTGMAANAGVGLMVGVLTGSGTRDQLTDHGADVLLSDVGGIPELLDDVMGRNGTERTTTRRAWTRGGNHRTS